MITGVAVPVTGEQAIERARELLALIAAGAVERDAERRFPYDALALLADAGLFAIGVPPASGGPGLSDSTIVEVARIVACADPNLAQIMQNHHAACEVLRANAFPDETVRLLHAELLDGAVFAGTSAERDGRQGEHRTRAVRADDGDWVIDGGKFYSTGGLGARWLMVGAVTDDGAAVRAFVPADDPGVARDDDWTGIGQRSTGSGTTTYRGCRVPAARAAVSDGTPHGSLFTPLLQGIHVAVQVGIARAALDDAVDFVKHGARAWSDAKVERASLDPYVIETVGALAAKVAAAEALFALLGPAIDTARHGGPDDIVDARIACAAARSFSISVALEAGDTLFALGGTRSALAEHGFDRHWRNARTHALQTPQKWTNHHLGNWILNDQPLPANGHI